MSSQRRALRTAACPLWQADHHRVETARLGYWQRLEPGHWPGLPVDPPEDPGPEMTQKPGPAPAAAGARGRSVALSRRALPADRSRSCRRRFADLSDLPGNIFRP